MTQGPPLIVDCLEESAAGIGAEAFQHTRLPTHVHRAIAKSTAKFGGRRGLEGTKRIGISVSY